MLSVVLGGAAPGLPVPAAPAHWGKEEIPRVAQSRAADCWRVRTSANQTRLLSELFYLQMGSSPMDTRKESGGSGGANTGRLVLAEWGSPGSFAMSCGCQAGWGFSDKVAAFPASSVFTDRLWEFRFSGRTQGTRSGLRPTI